VEKYLERYSEAGTEAVADMPVINSWGNVLVVPVCNEESAILRPLPPAPVRSLMILVVNEPELAQPRVSLANRAFADQLNARFELKWQSGPPAGLTLFRDPSSPRDVLLIDRFSEGLRFAGKGGVGCARKAGADIAACLYHQKRVELPWIHCSDADVVLPGRYFSVAGAIGPENTRTAAALIYPFRHVVPDNGVDDRVARMTRLYEYSLRYYVAGLKYAGSPYAFHTIGSTMAVHAKHYAKVRGFPRREAGEDFYLLNKLAKVGSIRTLDEGTQCGPIAIAARLSDRVPFGTGAAVAKMTQLRDPAREFLLYNPAVFGLLKGWLDALPLFWHKQSADLAEILQSSGLDKLIVPLNNAGTARALAHSLRQSSDSGRFTRHMHTWFDGFRTLKLIHYLRDHHYPSLSVEALAGEGSLDCLLNLEPELHRLHIELHGVDPF
jgi:hypothetical protein